jgi:chloramphenicol 3-O phosphotransferase
MTMPGKIILLNGASSAGKSTLARALQAALPEPFWHVSIDHLLAAQILPHARIQSGEFPWQSLRPAFFEGFYRCLPALAEAGNHLIVEHILETEASQLRLRELLAPFDVFYVGLLCPLPELERRARTRSAQKIEESRQDFLLTPRFGPYDLELDTTLPAEQNAATLLAAWQERPSRSQFFLPLA